MICSACEKKIPDDSAFCPFCGETVEKNKTSIKQKKRNIPVIITTAICILLIAALVYGYYYYEDVIRIYNNILGERETTIAELKTEIADKDKDIDQKKESLSSINTRLAEANKVISDNRLELEEYEYLYSSLSKAKTSNNMISVGSKIYAVKKGQSITINVNWHTSSTVYMGSANSYIAYADWVNNNVRVSGMDSGVTTIYFGSNSGCTSDRMEVVIICYE